MNNKIHHILVILSLLAMSAFLVSTLEIDDKGNNLVNDPDKNTAKTYEIRALKLPKRMDFAGEPAPLHKQDIRERLDRELLVNTYWQSNGLLMFKRAHKYFPIIEPILARNNVPDDFKYLAVAESGLLHVTSPAGAKGIWQLMAATGREHGLEINDNVDERYHIEKATEAACAYLKESKEKFGSWTLAAAAYNAGNKGIGKRLEEQKVDSYYELLLGSETSRYIPRILAIKEILSHPQKYGFVFDKNDLYEPQQFIMVKVDTAITDMIAFAGKFDMNYKELKILNPWLREDHLNNKSRKEYFIKVKN